MRAPYPSEAAEKLLIRFPDGMREKVAVAAQAAGRSMNAEVVARLEKSFADDGEQVALGDFVSELAKRIEALEGEVFPMGGSRDR